MEKCSRCGKEFDEEEVSMYLFDGDSAIYDNLRFPLCDECANDAWNSEEDGVFFDTCENCGKEFDVFEDKARFSEVYSDLDFGDFDKILCSDCALDAASDFLNNEEDYDEGEDDETISVYDAALIWASHGKDEDYTFGYSEEELKDALS